MPKFFKNVEVSTRANKPQVTNTKTGKAILKFSYAVGGAKKKDGSGYEPSSWYDAEFWADSEKDLPKVGNGDTIHFKGYEKVTEYNGKVYNKTAVQEVISVEPRGEGNKPTTANVHGQTITDEDIPF